MMNDLGVIDTFMAAFTGAIDSGFGLVSGDVATLTTILIGIDITLAGLLWLLDEGTDVLARLIRKVLYVGAFAFILNNFASLANVVFRSFAGLGLVAAGSGLSVDDLLKPGRLAGIGFQAAWPLLHQAGQLLGFTGLEQAEAAVPTAAGIAVENLRFRYAITGDTPPWRPVRAFDDGAKVYIQFPDRLDQGEAPPLFVVGADDSGELVNYRVRRNLYIVDRLFAAAELRLGTEPQQVVRISRTDGSRP